MQVAHVSPTPSLLVACLCAAWCGTCRDYQPLFDQLAKQFPQVHFRWVDIEDEADLVDPIEVENFPTLLIGTPDHTLFFGTLTPHIQTLQRLVQTQLADSERVLPADPQRDGLLIRLWRRAGEGK